MDPKMCLTLLLVFHASVLQLTFVNSDLIYYGNEARERTTSGMDRSITPVGPRIWVDDPLNCDSCPRWGYLRLYHVFIHGPSSSPIVSPPNLYLQIWTNTSLIGKYVLKWQKRLDNYQPGQLYKVAPDDGDVIEVTEFDRIGFTSDGNGSYVALDIEVEDTVTASTAHRTYFWLLYRDNYRLPFVGETRMVDNNALRGRFSIGVELDNAPPRKSTEVYIGHPLVRGQGFGSFVVVDDSIVLVSGRVTAFYFHLAQLTTTITVQLYVWQKIGNSFNYTLIYSRSASINQGPEKTYSVPISDGPQVNSSHRLGWNIPVGLYYTFSDSGASHRSIPSQGSSFTVGQTYAFDGLAVPYNMSVGVIVDQPITPAVSSSSTSRPSMTPMTSNGPPMSSLSTPTTTSGSRAPSSSNDNEISTTPLSSVKANGRSSQCSAFHWDKMSILRLAVTLHLLIACLSS